MRTRNLVLLLDDNAEQQEVLKSELQAAGHEVALTGFTDLVGRADELKPGVVLRVSHDRGTPHGGAGGEMQLRRQGLKMPFILIVVLPTLNSDAVKVVDEGIYLAIVLRQDPEPSEIINLVGEMLARQLPGKFRQVG